MRGREDREGDDEDEAQVRSLVDRETLAKAPAESMWRLAKYLGVGCACPECIAREIESGVSVRQEIVDWRSKRSA